jgi:hypothetical protein
MKIYFPLLLLLLALTNSTHAQELSIEGQFQDLIKKSNNYRGYKVVKKEKLYTLRSNVSDSIKGFKQEINSLDEEKTLQNSSIGQLTRELESTKKELAIYINKEKVINVLGILIQKSTYNLFVFFSLGFLLLIIVLLFVRFKNGYNIIKTTKEKLEETDNEFENFRQRSLEREQKIRRKLQDELNKHKK